MTLEFKPIELSDQSAYRDNVARCPEATSDYSFINLWAWASVYGLELAWADDLAWIRQSLPKQILWAPMGDWKKADWSRIFKNYPELGAEFIRVPEALVHIWESAAAKKLTAGEDRDQWDYVYDASELTELPGNKFHKKKNHINQFIKSYNYQYSAITADIVQQAKAMQNDWCEWRECASDIALAHENEAIFRVLCNWENLSGILGGCIMVDGRVAAYTVGERLLTEMMVIHFEKASADYKGIYQAINQMFLTHEAAGLKWVNREQDIGDEGLRKSKLSYHPARFLKKYRVSIEM